jgi:hypothetical protein
MGGDENRQKPVVRQNSPRRRYKLDQILPNEAANWLDRYVVHRNVCLLTNSLLQFRCFTGELTQFVNVFIA